MKRWNRLLAALLVALMLCGAWGAQAEMELEIDAPEAQEEAELELVSEPAEELPEEVGELELVAPELDDTVPEAQVAGNGIADEPEEESAEAQSNASGDFVIKNGVLTKYKGKGGDVVIPKGVTSIGGKAFYECDSLTSITIPSSVKRIEDGPHDDIFVGAFASCWNLAKISFSNKLTYIGFNAFNDCPSLREVTIPGSVATIADGAFEDCGHLKSLTISKGVAVIGDIAFWRCDSLTNVTIPSTVTSIGDSAFEECHSLTNVTIQGSKTSIKKNAFSDCDKLKSITILAKNIDIASNAFEGSDPTFHTVPGSAVSKWAKNHDFTVVEDVKAATSLVLKKSTTKTVAKGDSFKITLNGKKAKSFSSSNTGIATVSKSGLVKVKGCGKVKITVTLTTGKKLTLTLKIPYPKAKLSKSSLQLMVGKSATLSVSNLEGRTVTWSSSNKKIATVKQGKVTAVKAGKCTITAKVGSTKLTCAVTVVKPLKGDVHSILGKSMKSINQQLSDKLRYFEDDAYTNDYFLVQTDDGKITSIALMTDAESGIGKYTLFGLYPGMDYDKACKLLAKSGWKLDTEYYDESYFYNPKDSDVTFYVTIEDDCIDLIVYMYQ